MRHSHTRLFARNEQLAERQYCFEHGTTSQGRRHNRQSECRVPRKVFEQKFEERH
jgi:hypothetical protein